MYPVFTLALGEAVLSIKAYEAFCVLAALGALLTAPSLLRRAGLRTGKGLAFTLLLLAVFVIGARLLNVLVNPSAYGDLRDIFALRFTGFSLYGGVLAAVLALMLLSAAFGCDMWAAADALVLPGGIAFALARTGCFLNGCCAGIPTDSPLGVVFPEKLSVLGGTLGRLPFMSGLRPAVYPTQLFELALTLPGLAPVLWLYFRRRLPAGAAALLCAIWFTAMRWAILPLRALPYGRLVTGVFYPALYGSILLLCGLLLWRRIRRRPFRIGGQQGEDHLDGR